MEDIIIRADCACGQAKLEISGSPKTTMLCACRDCQKASGTDHTALGLWPDAAINVQGQTQFFETTADSGATVQRHRCATCGTPIFGLSSRLVGHRLIPLGLLGEWANQFAPKSMIFARSKFEWDHTSDGLAQYTTYREN